MRKKNKLVRPFLKWAGGKRQLLPEIRRCMPKRISTYYEPFLGGGAVLFDLQPQKSVVNDINAESINVYEVIRRDVESLIPKLKRHKNDKEHYYKTRERDRDRGYKNLDRVTRAARIIYLNKTCYNGLFRVNRQGQFNVPFGRYEKPEIVNEVVLRAVSNYLNEADIQFSNIDFEESLSSARRGNFVYLDPPYDPVSDTASFTGYTLNGFPKDEQERLKRACDKLDRKGCRFLLSNSATPFILELYRKYKTEIVHVGRNINSVASKRGKIEEVLVRNYE